MWTMGKHFNEKSEVMKWKPIHFFDLQLREEYEYSHTLYKMNEWLKLQGKDHPIPSKDCKL